MPKVSVVIPVYNVEKYLNECIESILNQTYKDFEIILVDDGSTDKSGEICDDYANKYDCITVIHQDNQGQASARNNGVKIATSEWIAFIDSDDVAHPQMLEYLWKAREESGSKISACYRVQGTELPENFYNSMELKYEKLIINEKALIKLYESNSSIYWALFPSIIHKVIYTNFQMEKGRIYEDNAVCCKWLYEAGTVSVVNSDMYFYRTNPNSTMNKPFTLKQLDYLWALNEQIKFYNRVEYKKMRSKIALEYLNTAIYFHNISKSSVHEKEIKCQVKRNIKNFLSDNRKDIVINDELQRKLDKILNPFTFKLKKRLNIY